MARKRKFTPSEITPATPMEETFNELSQIADVPSEKTPETDIDLSGETIASEEVAKVEAVDVVDPKQPVNLELRVGSNESNTPKELTKESIEVSVRKKLAKKTDDEKSDPFVPQAQLDNEVVQVAREKGFPLSRGTEIGARLLARARRPNG